MNYTNVQQLLEGSQTYCKEWNDYIQSRKRCYKILAKEHLKENLISEANWVMRSQLYSAYDLGLEIRVGDIVFLDYGQMYLNEMGYQHFGLVMNVFHKKALIIPMTSNPIHYENAYDELENPSGKPHLLRFGMVGEMDRPSVLYMNDLKFLNTARIIARKGHLDIHSSQFIRIQERMKEVLFFLPEDIQ